MVGAHLHAFSNSLAELTGTVTVFNSAAQTITIPASSLVGPSEWNSTHNVTVTLSGNTSNASTVSGTNIILSATNNLTLSGSSNSIVISGSVQQTVSHTYAGPYMIAGNLSTLPSPNNLNPIFGLVAPPQPVTFTGINIPYQIQVTTGTASATASHVFACGLYSLTGGTFTTVSSASLTLLWTGSGTSNSLSLTGAGGSTSYTIGTSALMTIANKVLQWPMSGLLAMGTQYMLALSQSSAGASFSFVPVCQLTLGLGFMATGSGTGAGGISQSSAFNRNYGGYFSSTTAAMPASITTASLIDGSGGTSAAPFMQYKMMAEFVGS